VEVSYHRHVLEDGPVLSDSSDHGNKPDELDSMYAPGCSQGNAQLGDLEAFILCKASRGDLELSRWFKEGKEAKAQSRGFSHFLPGLFRGIHGLSQRDYSLQAIVKIAGRVRIRGDGMT
jgi:hypothetical protein